MSQSNPALSYGNYEMEMERNCSPRMTSDQVEARPHYERSGRSNHVPTSWPIARLSHINAGHDQARYLGEPCCASEQ